MTTNHTFNHPVRENLTKGTNAMGTRHDLTGGTRTGITTLERPATRTPRRAEAFSPSRPQTYAPHLPHAPRTSPDAQPQRTRRLGSKQVVSVRGRQVGKQTEVKRAFSAVTVLGIPLLIIGVVAAMLLSGLSTSQAFSIQQLQTQERELSNEVESLHRNLEDRRSTAEITQRAAELGMVVPSEPGIISVNAEGTAEEQRAFNAEAVRPIIDVNGTPARSDRATSDRNATNEVGDRLTTLPGGNVLGRDEATHNEPQNQQQRGALNEQPTLSDPNASAPLVQPENLAPYAPNVAAGR